MASEALADAAPTRADRERAWIKSLAGRISFLSSGERAGLRRWELTRSFAADGTVVKLLVEAGVPRTLYDGDFDRWRLVAHVAAVLIGTGTPQSDTEVVWAHAEGRRLGRALHEAGFSEARLLRLLAARGEALHDQVRSAARFLAGDKKPVNLWTLYRLVGSDDGEAEAARIRIAQDFYAADARSKKEPPSDD